MNNSNDPVDLLQIKIENAKAKLPAETLNAIAAVDWKAAILALRDKKGYNFEQLGNLEMETELMLCGLTNPSDYPKELQTRMRLSKADTDELVNEMNTQVFQKIKAEMIKNSERKKIFEKKDSAPVLVSIKSETPAAKPAQTPMPGPAVAPTPKPAAAPVPEMTFAPKPAFEVSKTDDTILKSAGIEVENPTTPAEKLEKPIENREDMLKKVESPEPSKIVSMHPAMQQKLSAPFQMPVVKTEHIIGSDPAVQQTPSTPAPASSPRVDPYRELPE